MNFSTPVFRVPKALFRTILLMLFVFSSASQAAIIRVTVENNASVGGLSFTPLYSAFHSAAFDAFDVGGTASAGLEQLAELGGASTLASERLMVDPGSVGGVVFPTGGMRPLFPGESGYREFNITDTVSNQYFTFLSMILPSNDTFLGRDNALQLFDAAGYFLGNQVINVTGADLWDAGTEGLDTTAAPFIPGNTPTDSPADALGVIRAAESLASFAGITLANGQVLDANLIDFLSDPASFNVATITIEQIPEPAIASLFLAGVLGLGLAARRRKVHLN